MYCPSLIHPPLEPYRLLRETPGKDPSGSNPDRDEKTDQGSGGNVLVCAACRAFITNKTFKVEIDGQHEHVEVNPAGLVFHIGCFSLAPGAIGVGKDSAEWSWFPGYTWQIAVCARCGTHVGWFFRSANHSFAGLALDRLVEEKEV